MSDERKKVSGGAMVVRVAFWSRAFPPGGIQVKGKIQRRDRLVERRDTDDGAVVESQTEAPPGSGLAGALHVISRDLRMPQAQFMYISN